MAGERVHWPAVVKRGRQIVEGYEIGVDPGRCRARYPEPTGR